MIDYAKQNKAIIIYDAAYEAFITQPDIPHSIFEVEGARTCAIEMCSLSKTAGFTGMRCGYTVIPNELTVTASDGTVLRFGADGREASSMVFLIRYSVQLLLFSQKKAESRFRRTLLTIRKMQPLSAKPWMNWESRIQVA